ncbi:MAG: hypothetical protein NT145_01655 [Elusimicrobia bacterium]|nr:hypothetical protein [Elusimicrobiota bacterium]
MKIGSVSWIKRGTYLENAKALERYVDFVELLIFSWDSDLKRQLTEQLDGLRKLDVFYTVHLPADTIENCRKAYSFFRKADLPVKNFTLHPLTGWEDFIKDKNDVALENLIDNCPVFERMAIDIGHLKISGKEELVLGSAKLQSVKELHLHGVISGKDHSTLNKQTIKYVHELTKRHRVLEKAFGRKDFLVNFEIFDFPKLLVSLKRFKSYEFAKN